MSKFDTIFEAQIGRFVKSGPIAGDYVKFASNMKSSDLYSGLDEARKAYVDQIVTVAEEGKPLMLSTIKKADCIYEFLEGKINCYGNYQYLLDNSESFKKISLE